MAHTKPTPLNSLYVWAGLSLFVLEFVERAIYLQTQPYLCCPLSTDVICTLELVIHWEIYEGSSMKDELKTRHFLIYLLSVIHVSVTNYLCYHPTISVTILTPHKCYKFPCSEVLTYIEGGLY